MSVAPALIATNETSPVAKSMDALIIELGRSSGLGSKKLATVFEYLKAFCFKSSNVVTGFSNEENGFGREVFSGCSVIELVLTSSLVVFMSQCFSIKAFNLGAHVLYATYDPIMVAPAPRSARTGESERNLYAP